MRKQPGILTAMAVMVILTLVVGAPMAQASDRYRAEFVILERIVAPENISENMSGQAVAPTPTTNKALWVTPEGGGPRSSLNLTSGLYLDSAATRLVNSGRFRVLAKAGWHEDFPQNYRGERLAVAIGDWLPRARQRGVEGYIKIDRQRFLHVKTHLNHWRDAPAPAHAPEASAPMPSGIAEPASAVASAPLTRPEPGLQRAPELLTWIRETRRMRSSEIHFLDSPTIGVLVYFAKIED